MSKKIKCSCGCINDFNAIRCKRCNTRFREDNDTSDLLDDLFGIMIMDSLFDDLIDSSDCSDSSSFDNFGGGDFGGGGASGDWSSDSGSYDSGSCDCGGGCD